MYESHNDYRDIDAIRHENNPPYLRHSIIEVESVRFMRCSQVTAVGFPDQFPSSREGCWISRKASSVHDSPRRHEINRSPLGVSLLVEYLISKTSDHGHMHE